MYTYTYVSFRASIFSACRDVRLVCFWMCVCLCCWVMFLTKQYETLGRHNFHLLFAAVMFATKLQRNAQLVLLFALLGYVPDSNDIQN